MVWMYGSPQGAQAAFDVASSADYAQRAAVATRFDLDPPPGHGYWEAGDYS
jgi:hypothetical protein